MQIFLHTFFLFCDFFVLFIFQKALKRAIPLCYNIEKHKRGVNKMPKDILDDLMLEEGLDFSPKKDNRVTEVIDLEGDTTPVAEEKDYDLIRNNVKLLKTDLDYIYQLKDGSGYVYRLYQMGNEESRNCWFDWS